MKKPEHKAVFDYSNNEELLLGREVVIGLKSGTNVGGEVRFINGNTIVVVNEPSSTLEIETQIVHTIVNLVEASFIQFKTKIEKKLDK
jgi:hypothetical protein